MALQLLGDTPEERSTRTNASEMAEAIVIEMKKRGMGPDDWMAIQSATDRAVHRNTKNVWKDETND